MPNSGRASTRNWTKTEIYHLLDWIEEHREKLQGSQIGWHRKVKDRVFGTPEFDHINIKRIGDK